MIAEAALTLLLAVPQDVEPSHSWNERSLFVQSQQPRDIPIQYRQRIEKLEKDLDRLKTEAWMFGILSTGVAADIVSTEVCIYQNPNCREGNPSPWMQASGTSRLASQIVYTAGVMAGAHFLLKRGHKKLAWVLVGGSTAVKFGLAAHNLKLAGR